jgi:hypothetical protein
MQLRISFLFSYASFLWMAQAAGIEGSTFLLCNSTAFRLCMEGCMNSCHSSRSYLMFIAAIRPLMFLQSLIWPCDMNDCLKSFRKEWNAVTFAVLSRRFEFEVLTTTVVPYTLKVLGLWWGSGSFFCMILCVFLCVASSSSSQSRKKLSRDSGIGRPSQRGTGQIVDGIFGYSSVHFFSLVIPFWLGGTIQKWWWFVSFLHIRGTADSMEHPLRFTHVLSRDEQDIFFFFLFCRAPGS